MKNLVLGMILIATSAVYAQDVPTINLNDVKPTSLRKVDMKLSRKHEIMRRVEVDRREPLATGVVRIVNGQAVIVLMGEMKKNRVYAVNLPKASKVDGRILQFRMRDSRAQIPLGMKASRAVVLDDLVVLPTK